MFASQLRQSFRVLVGTVLVTWYPWAVARLSAAEVHVRVDQLWVEPADIVITEGDRVFWDLQVEGARLWDLEGRFDFRTHPPQPSRAPFNFVFNQPGLYAYEYLRLSTTPPCEPYYGLNYVFRGTVEVEARRCETDRVTLHSPVGGAVFPAVYFADGTPTAIPAVIPLLASAESTNGLERMEYQFDGRTVAVASNWTAVVFGSTSRTGAVTVTARAVYSGGKTVYSASRRVQVVGCSQPGAEGGVLETPRHVHGNLYVVEYRTGGGASWYLRQISDVGRNLPADAAVATIYLRAYNGGWGRFPFLANEPRQFIWFYRRH